MILEVLLTCFFCFLQSHVQIGHGGDDVLFRSFFLLLHVMAAPKGPALMTASMKTKAPCLCRTATFYLYLFCASVWLYDSRRPGFTSDQQTASQNEAGDGLREAWLAMAYRFDKEQRLYFLNVADLTS